MKGKTKEAYDLLTNLDKEELIVILIYLLKEKSKYTNKNIITLLQETMQSIEIQKSKL